MPEDSSTATFVAFKVHVDNWRWTVVPFYLRTGKSLPRRSTEISIHFEDIPKVLFNRPPAGPLRPNVLTIRVQPDEAIHLSLMNKVPGMGMRLASRNLDLQYKEAFSELIPGAYESLLMDVIRGDQSLFIRNSELEAAWDVFTPVLHEIEQKKIVPAPYPFGSRGPDTGERFKL